jgi:hypothetical protein
MPARRPRLNATIRYGAPAATLIILALLVLSRWTALTAILHLSPSRAVAASLASGCLILGSNTTAYQDEGPSPPADTGAAIAFASSSIWTKSQQPYLDLWFSTGERTFYSMADGPTTNCRDTAIPLWVLALIPAAAAALARRRRQRPGICPCGYTAPASPRRPCPECADG